MVRMRPEFDGFDETDPPEGMGTFYDGPPPPPGIYHGTLKKLGLAKIGSGDSKGSDRLAVLVEIDRGKYKGAGVFHSLNMTKQGGYFVNQFLWAMTDGSDRQKDALRNMFWRKGYDVAKEPDGKMGKPISVIGAKFVPVGRELSFVTTMDNDLEGNPRPKIVRFVVPVEGKEEEPESEPDDDLAGLDEFAAPTTTNPAEDEKPDEGVDLGSAFDTEGAQDLDDDDDPWS